MKKKINKAIVAFLITFNLSINQFAIAQIAYTDIQDVFFECRKDCILPYYLDINNDGNNDFIFEVITRKLVNYKCAKISCKYFENIVAVSTFPGRSVMATLVLTNQTSLAIPLQYGAAISSASEWNNNSGGGGIQKYSSTSGCTNEGSCAHYNYGNWINSTDHFLGIKFFVNDYPYYGWIRMAVFLNETKASCTIKDFAYQTSPDTPILAGDKGETGTSKSTSNRNEKEITNKSSEIKVTPNPISSTAKINFSISKPGKVSLNLYAISGRLVKTISEKTFTEGNHQITLDTKDLNAGIYFIRLKSDDLIGTKKFVVIK